MAPLSGIYFSNFQIHESKEYFLYIGELKNYGLVNILKETLSDLQNREFDFIAIVPDIFEQYNYRNLIVINPVFEELTCRYGQAVSCRISAKDFVAAVSANRHVLALVHRILKRQNRLHIFMYESLPEMTLDEIEGVSILGPDKHAAHKLNNKIFQYTSLQPLLPTPDFQVCESFDGLLNQTNELWDQWTDGIFVTREYSAAGINAVIAHTQDDIFARFGKERQDPWFLISRYHPHEYDPTVLAVVANPDEIYVAGIADQRIEGGLRFTGSSFPSKVSANVAAKLKKYTRIAGRWLAERGYRGIYGCDYLVDANDNIRFLEINARKQGTTLEFCYTLEQTLPPGSPLLPELEYYAVTENIFPYNTVEMESNTEHIHWSTFNYKLKNMAQTEGYIPQGANERDAFAQIAKGRLKKDFLILEHIGSDFIVAKGAFLARIVALGTDETGVLQGLRQATRSIELTLTPTMEENQNE